MILGECAPEIETAVSILIKVEELTGKSWHGAAMRKVTSKTRGALPMLVVRVERHVRPHFSRTITPHLYSLKT
jgi:hypothetical protein